MAGVFQTNIVDHQGNVLAAASVEIRHENTGALASLFTDIDLTSHTDNPATTDSNGFVRVYSADGLYRIVASRGGFEREWRHFAIGLTISSDFSADLEAINAELADNAAEIAAAVASIDAAGAVAINHGLQLFLLGSPRNRYGSEKYDLFQLDTETVTLPEGVSLQTKFNAIETDTLLLGQTISLLGAKNDLGTAFILNSGAVRIDSDAGETLASEFTGIHSSLDDNAADIITEATTRASADSAMASNITTLFSSVGTNAAAIVTEASTRASADTAISSTVTALSSTVSGHTSSISTLSSTTSTLSGDVTDLQARYGVAINVDGHISGFVLNSDDDIASFSILADVFEIVDPDNDLDDPLPVFSVVDGVVALNDLVVAGNVRLGNVQTFTPGWSGFSSAPTGLCSYVDLGSVVLLIPADGSFSGTSNANSMSLTGLPTALRPSTAVVTTCVVFDSNSLSGTVGQAQINTNGSIDFQLSTLPDPGASELSNFDSHSFAASSSKGWRGCIWYPKL